MTPLSVRAVGMLASVGNTAPECAASVRAGITRVAETSVMSRAMSPLRMGLVPPASFPRLPAVDVAPRASRHRRVLKLAHAAITEASDVFGGLALPLTLVTGARDDASGPMLDDLASLLGERVDGARSRHVAAGAAGVFLALLDAAHRIERGEARAVLIAGADTMLDLVRLDALQVSRRVLVDDVMDGFLPGEGAAALVVTGDAPGGLATIAVTGVARDAFRHEGDHALNGDGLTEAVHAALTGTTEPVREVWAGLNGESWTAREWGLAARRAHRNLATEMKLHHPVESFGDPGGALGAMLLVLAALGVYRGTSRGPSLVWSLSDEGLRGAARVERAVTE